MEPWLISIGGQRVDAEPKVAVDRAAISVSRDRTFLEAARQLNLVVRRGGEAPSHRRTRRSWVTPHLGQPRKWGAAPVARVAGGSASGPRRPTGSSRGRDATQLPGAACGW